MMKKLVNDQHFVKQMIFFKEKLFINLNQNNECYFWEKIILSNVPGRITIQNS